MEGLLSKWTNVMKGWQFRWFVLDEHTGLLSYYTSKEKMRRGVRRGCIRLQGAVLGIDDEEDANFTITVDAKVFHLQAKDAEERELWVRALEEAILKHARLRPGAYLLNHLSNSGASGGEPMVRFELRLAQADAYLQILIQHVADLEENSELPDVVAKANEFLEAVKHSIVLLQIAKNTAFPVAGLSHPVVLHYSDPEIQTGIEFGSECSESGSSGNVVVVSGGHGHVHVPMSSVANVKNIVGTSRVLASTASVVIQSPISPSEKKSVFISYSSSDDEQDFYDASEDFENTNSNTDNNKENKSVAGGGGGAEQQLYFNASEDGKGGSGALPNNPNITITRDSNHTTTSREDSGAVLSLLQPSPSTNTLNYDSLYDEDLSEDDLGSVEVHGSVLSHLLSQVKIGMDLTKVVLPTFILERRSLLEMYADFFAHPDMFVSIADAVTSKDRMVAILKWYLGAFYAGRRSEVAKKPYNPILGEIFQCYWNSSGKDKVKESADHHSHNSNSNSSSSSNKNEDNSNVNSNGQLFPWVEDADALVFFGEQVSHHPPISAFYAEHVKKQISLNAHIWTKSKFLGLSVGVHNIGHAMLTLHSPSREDYVLGFPNGYARSIFSVPWVELGGPVTISSSQTGFNARVEFHTKPFFGGEKNKITAQVFSPEDKKKPFLQVEGEWNGVMTAKWADGKTERFIDVQNIEIVRKRTKPILQQETYESRRMWKEVTAGLKFRDIDKATDAKFALEEKQRNEARERREKGESWKPKMFIPAGDTWIFSEPLEQRLKAMKKQQQQQQQAT